MRQTNYAKMCISRNLKFATKVKKVNIKRQLHRLHEITKEYMKLHKITQLTESFA